MKHTSRRALLHIAALGLALAGVLAISASPAQAATVVAGSCSSHYRYVMVGQSSTAAPILMPDGKAHGYISAALWVKEYTDKKGNTVSCVQYHSSAHVCAAPGMTLDAGDVSAYLIDNSTGIVGNGWNTTSFDALKNGACSHDVTSIDSLAGDVDAHAPVSGIGNYASMAYVVTTPFFPKGMHV